MGPWPATPAAGLVARLVATNARTGLPLAERTRATRGPWDRMRGLLARAPLGVGEGLLIAPCNGIHTVGMRYAIDVVFIDRDGRVLRVTRALPPLRCSPAACEISDTVMSRFARCSSATASVGATSTS